LNSLNGIIELPYFENSSVNIAHRIHSYDSGSSTSRFRYYYYRLLDLPIEASRYDDFIRGEESYRHVFENSSSHPQIPFSVSIPAKDGDEDGMADEVMVGNPFPSSLNFEIFYRANSSLIEDYYLLYEDGNFSVYPLSNNPPLIAPLQAFFVKPKVLSDEIILTFPEASSVVRSSSHQLKTSQADGFKQNLLKIGVQNESGNSWMLLSMNQDMNQDIMRMFSVDKPSVPQIYSVDSNGNKEVLRYVNMNETNQNQVELGIRSESTGIFTLNFENLEEFHVEYLVLMDRDLNVIQNLFKDNRYSFTNTSGNLNNRFVLILGKQYSPTGYDKTEDTSVSIVTSGKSIFVESGVDISEIRLLTAQGLQVLNESVVGSNSFRRELSVPEGVYIATVKLITGESKTEKIIVRK
jgi:hypothetical protein